MARSDKLTYSYNLNCFRLEDEKKCRLAVTFMKGGKYSFIIEIDGHKKYLDGLSDYFTLFLLSNLVYNLTDHSFTDALKEMCHSYEKIQEIEKELKNNENSTN
jgi:hypothetical protein